MATTSKKKTAKTQHEPAKENRRDGLVRQFKAARRVSVPLIWIKTPDASRTQTVIADAVNGDRPAAKLSWDVVRGVHALNDAGREALRTLGDDKVQETVQNPTAMLVIAQGLPERTVLFFHNAQRFIDDVSVMQAAANLRDAYKGDRRTLVLLGPSAPLPVELQTDVLVLDEPLPAEAELREIVQEQISAAGDQIEFAVTPELLTDAAGRLKGTSAFAAEQLTAMSLGRSAIDMHGLDEQARELIEQTPGLAFERGAETFEDIGGLDFAKAFGSRLFGGPLAPSVVVRVEEIEKVMSGAKGDLSGTSGDALQVLLSEMEDNGWTGMLAFGAPGAGKSLFAKSLANTFNARPIRFDMNATKGSLVGQSEQRIRAALKVIKTIGGSRVFFLASCNRLDSLPAELQRRFRCGVWFFDIPGPAELSQIWDINRARFGIADDDETPAISELTGADVRNICEMAAALRCSLSEALAFVVPLKQQSPTAVADARAMAANKFICATRGGVYETPDKRRARGERPTRTVEVE
jgi:hypothetical protein